MEAVRSLSWVVAAITTLGWAQYPASAGEPPGVFQAEAVLPLFEDMRVRRVSIDCVGDSNMYGVGASGPKFGYFGAVGQVLEEKGFPWYGAACAPASNANNLTRWARPGKNKAFGVSASNYPSWMHAAFLMPGSNANSGPLQYGHVNLKPGLVVVDAHNVGSRLGSGNPPAGFYVTGESYTAHVAYGTFGAPPGADNRFSYRLWTYAPSQELASSGLIDPVTGVNGVGFTSFSGTLPPTHDHSLAVGLGDGAVGPHVLFYAGMTRDSIGRGFTQNCVWDRGGLGLSELRDFITTTSNAGLRLYLRQLVAAQHSEHKVLGLFVMVGMNDRSTHPGVWEDDLRAVLDVYEGTWDHMLSEAGWTGDLYFLLWPGPHSNLNSPQNLPLLRERARTVASERERTCVIDLDALGADPAYILSQPGWTIMNDGGGLDSSHLKNAGYVGLVRQGMTALLGEPDCEADLNGDGITSMLDFFVLASNFGLSDARFEDGDFTGDGEVGLADFHLLATNFGCDAG